MQLTVSGGRVVYRFSKTRCQPSPYFKLIYEFSFSGKRRSMVIFPFRFQTRVDQLKMENNILWNEGETGKGKQRGLA